MATETATNAHSVYVQAARSHFYIIKKTHTHTHRGGVRSRVERSSVFGCTTGLATRHTKNKKVEQRKQKRLTIDTKTPDQDTHTHTHSQNRGRHALVRLLAPTKQHHNFFKAKNRQNKNKVGTLIRSKNVYTHHIRNSGFFLFFSRFL